MSNAIDDIGAKVVGNRWDGEADEAYALRVLQTLYRSHEALNAPGWIGDQETNEYRLVLTGKTASIVRGFGAWSYIVYEGNACLVQGEARYLEKAMQLCSLALAE